MLLMFVTAQAHFSALAQTRPPTCPPTCVVPPPPPGAQHPTLLAGYAVRPPWKVAGVDYAVGVPSTATLTDWQLLSGPGIAVNATAVPPHVDVYNTSNVVISGVDFSLHGGASLRFENSPNGTVISSNFGGINLTQTLNCVIWADPQSPGLTVKYSTVDGGGPGLLSTLISNRGAGTITLEYNWLKNSPQHVLEEVQLPGVPSAIVYRYNLVERNGRSAGAHLNILQSPSDTVTPVDVEFNTTYQTPQAASGEGFQFGGHNIIFAYNTMIATGGARGSAMSYMVHADGPLNVPAVAHDNYVDPTAAYGWIYPGSVNGWYFYNNYNMTTGAAF
jgi:hypothetical protein